MKTPGNHSSIYNMLRNGLKNFIERIQICQNWAKSYYKERFSCRGQVNAEGFLPYLVEY